MEVMHSQEGEKDAWKILNLDETGAELVRKITETEDQVH
jgi:hypothetical protein